MLPEGVYSAHPFIHPSISSAIPSALLTRPSLLARRTGDITVAWEVHWLVRTPTLLSMQLRPANYLRSVEMRSLSALGRSTVHGPRSTVVARWGLFYEWHPSRRHVRPAFM